MLEGTIVRNGVYVQASLEAELSFVGGDPFILTDYIIRAIHLPKTARLVDGLSP